MISVATTIKQSGLFLARISRYAASGCAAGLSAFVNRPGVIAGGMLASLAAA